MTDQPGKPGTPTPDDTPTPLTAATSIYAAVAVGVLTAWAAANWVSAPKRDSVVSRRVDASRGSWFSGWGSRGVRRREIRGGSIMASSVVVPSEVQTAQTQRSLTAATRTSQMGGQAPNEHGLAGVVRRIESVELAVCNVLHPFTLPALRILLGVLFVWFGGLKVTGTSPVEAMVSGTLPWLDPTVAVVGLGGVEIVLGAALVAGLGLRTVLSVLVMHLAGTFLAFAMMPGLMISGHNPLLLTESGEFVVKNLVLIGGALVLLTHHPDDRVKQSSACGRRGHGVSADWAGRAVQTPCSLRGIQG